MLKSYKELSAIDVTPYCDYREAKDDKGKAIQVPYLNWAICKKLLHENGAETVFFEPCINSNGSSLFMSDIEFIDKNGVANRCYEVRVKITIDSLVFEAQFPLMNGSNPVKDNSMTQQRLWNAQTRAFVKGVAMMTGLGFELWINEEKKSNTEIEEDLNAHNIMLIKKRLMEEYTKLIKKRMTTSDIAKSLEMTEDEVKYFFTLFEQIDRFEKKLIKLL